MSTLGLIGMVAGLVFAVVVLAFILYFSFTRLFKKATKDVAYVRTGFGKPQVCTDGAIMVIGGLHNITPVNLQLMRLPVTRKETDALTTKDRIKVDVTCTFFTNVRAEAADIALAASKYNDKTMSPDVLVREIGDQFVDAIRAAAMTMTMQELVERRSDFANAIKQAVTPILSKTGLEISDVSITNLQQTNIKFFDPNDINDAEGLKNIARVVTENAKLKNEIEQTGRIEVEQRNYDANLRSLEIARNDAKATLDQQREIETARIQQDSDLEKQRAEREKEANVARIEAKQQTEIAEVEANRLLEEERVRTKKAVDLRNQEARIEIARKSEEESVAQAAAANAKAEATLAEEKAKTVSAVEVAQREKEVAKIAAERIAQEEATKIIIAAKAEFEAAELRKNARVLEADALEREYEVKAEGERKLSEAANSMSDKQIELKIKLAAIDKAPEIVREQAAPIASIKDARLISLTGAGDFAGGVTGSGAQSTGNVGTDLINALGRHRVQSPIIDAIVGGLAGFDVTGAKFASELVGEEQKPALTATVDQVARPNKLAATSEKSGSVSNTTPRSVSKAN